MHMRKTTQHIGEAFAALMIFAIAIVPLPTNGQRGAGSTGAPKRAASPKPKVAYYADFKVIIVGRGTKPSEHIGDPEIRWAITRTYKGQMELTGPHPVYRNSSMTSRGKRIPTSDKYEVEVSRTKPVTVHVNVNDMVQRIWNGPGEMGTHEDKNRVTIWEEDADEAGEGLGAGLYVDNETAKYTLIIDVVPEVKEHKVRMRQWTFIDRSDAGYGGKPTREFLTEADEFVSVNSLVVPEVPVFYPVMALDRIGSTTIVREQPWLMPEGGMEFPLPSTYPDKIEQRQKCYEPAKPMITGVPDSKTNVRVCVEYRFSKTPL